jgi:hypothetical protein
VQDGRHVVIEAQDDALADPCGTTHNLLVRDVQRPIDRSQDGWTGFGHVRTVARVLLMVGALLSARAAGAQAVATADAAQDPPAQDLPVSLDRIREQLKRPPESLLRNLDVKPDFSVQIEEQRRLDEIMSKLSFKSGPAPAGGLYSYQQQRQLFNPVDHPLQQPYAAFSGGELITIAIENLIGKYLGGRARGALSSAERSHAEAEARQDVDRAVAEYCAGRSDRDTILLCNPP